jgi:anaerobic magnesium-protoporphyrin IX monomethyl ester cyclase
MIASNGPQIVLMYPNFRTSDVFSQACLNVGLGYIAGALQAAGIRYEVVDLNIDSEEHLIGKTRELRPSFLGVSMLSYRCIETYELLNRLKQEMPRMRIVAGGPHVTANRDAVLAECPAIDVGVVGEGEAAIVDILRGRALSEIKGVLYRDQGEVKFTGERDFIHDLDEILFPTYEGFDLDKYGDAMPLHSSRGCPYRCIFCGAPRILGRRWRKRSAANMVEEVKYWHQRGYRKFCFSDSNLAVDKARVRHFCEAMIESNLQVHFIAEGMRADHVNRELLDLMKRAGFTGIAFGVESGNNRVLQNLRKDETREQIESAISAAVGLGFDVSLFFLIGAPGESAEDIEQSLELSRKYNVASAYFFNLTPIPGTEFYDWAVARGYVDGSQAKYPQGNFGFSDQAAMRTDTLTMDQLTGYIKLARRTERQIAHRHLLCRHFSKNTVQFPSNGGILNSVSWFTSSPAIEPVFRRMCRTYARAKRSCRFLRDAVLQPGRERT